MISHSKENLLPPDKTNSALLPREEICQLRITPSSSSVCNDWKEIYYQWAEKSSWFSLKEVIENDPHVEYYQFMPWKIRYHPSSIASLKNYDPRKIVDSLMAFAERSEKRENPRKSHLTAVVLFENQIKIAVVVELDLNEEEKITESEREKNKGMIIVLEIGEDQVCEEAVNGATEFLERKESHRRVLAVHKIRKDLKIFMRIKENNKFALYKEFEICISDEDRVIKMHNFNSEIPKNFQIEVSIEDDQGKFAKFIDIPLKITEEYSDIFVFGLEKTIFQDSMTEQKLMPANELWSYFYAIISYPDRRLNMEDMLNAFKQELERNNTLQESLKSVILSPLNTLLKQKGAVEDKLDEQILKFSLVLYSFCIGEDLLMCENAVSKIILSSLNHYKLVTWNESKYFSEILAMISQHIMNYKRIYQKAIAREHFEYVKAIGDKLISRQIFENLFEILKKSSGELFKSDIDIMQQYLMLDPEEKFIEVHSVLSLWSNDFSQTLEFLKILKDKGAKISDKHCEKIQKLLGNFLEENEGLAIFAKIIKDIFGNTILIQALNKAGFKNKLKKTLSKNIDRAYLEHYKAIFFCYYIEDIVENLDREKYILARIKDRIIQFSDFSEFFEAGLVDISISKCSVDFFVDCFESCAFQVINKMSNKEYFAQGMRHLENLTRYKEVDMYPVFMETLFTKAKRDITEILLLITEERPEVALIQSYKTHFTNQEIASCTAEFENIYQKLCKSEIEVIQWTLAMLAARIEPLTKIEFEQTILEGFSVKSYLFYILEQPDIFQHARIFKETKKFFCEFWQSIAAGNEIITVSTVRRIHKACVKTIAMYIAKCINSETKKRIAERIKRIKIMYKSKRKTHISLESFLSNYCRKILFLEETTKEFDKFKTTCLRKSLKDYILPDACACFCDISLKLFPLATSKLFNQIVNQDKNIVSCKDAKTLISLLEYLFSELKTKFQQLCVEKYGMKIESITSIFQVDMEMKKEIEICENAFKIQVNDKLKRCLSHLYTMKESIEFYQSILDIDDLFRLENQEFKMKCKDYLTLLYNYENQTVELFITVSDAAKEIYNRLAPLNDPANFRIFNGFSKSKMVLKFLLEKSKSDMYLIDEETFIMLKDGLEDKEYEPSLTKDDICDLEELWKFMKELPQNISTEGFIENICNRFKDFERNEKYLKSCMKNFTEIKELYFMQSNREGYKNEIIKKIFKHSLVELKKGCVSLKYKKKAQKSLTIHELLDLKNKSSLEIIKQNRPDPEDQENLNINEAFIKFVEVLINLESTVKSLYHLGYMDIQEEKKFECRGHEYELLSQFQDEVSHMHEEWTSLLINLYKEKFCLTFLSGHEFWNIANLIRSHALDNLTIFLLQFMQKDYSAMSQTAKQEFQQELMKIEVNDQYSNNLNKLRDTLMLIGNFLDAIPNAYPIKYNCPCVTEKRNLIKFDSEKILIYQGENIFDALVSIYVNSSAEIPRLHQVLWCKKETPWREINAFLYRWFTSPELELYTIIECENLKIKYQAKFLELLIELIRENQNFKKFSLLTKSMDSEIASKLKHRAKIILTKIKDNQILTDENLRKVIQMVTNFTQVHTSRCVGLGKTKRIRALAHQKNLTYYEILMAGEISYSSIGNLFKSNNLQSKALVHLCIGTVEDSKYIEEVLQSLSLFRMLISKKNKFCLPEGSILCIEIENTPDNWLYNDINYLKILKNYSIDFLDPNTFDYTQETEHVGKYLVLFKTDRILKESLHYKNNLPCNITSEEIKQAIIEQIECQKRVKEVNFYQIKIFFRFIFITLQYFEENWLFSSSSIGDLILDLTRMKMIDIGKKLQPIRKTIFQTILAAADYFTLKQVKSISYSQEKSVIGEVKDEEINIQLDTKEFLCLVFCKDGELLIINDKMGATKEIKILMTIQECIVNKFQEDKGKGFFSKKYDLKGTISNKIAKNEYNISDYSKMSNIELREKLIKIVDPIRSEGQGLNRSKYVSNYVLTFDNFTKMILIYYKSLAKIPIVIMGETGCGKTALLRYFVTEILQEELLVFSINAGTTLEAIDEYMQNAMEKAKKITPKNLWIFFDEFNTTPCITFLCQIICENRYKNIKLPSNIVVTAACNPYRTKKVSETEEIGIKKQSRMYKKTSKLVHNVKRLPSNAVEYIWNFGVLTTDTFCSYINSMLRPLCFVLIKKLDSFVTLLEYAHAYFTEKVDKSSISLRDVARFIDIYSWFQKIRIYEGYKAIKQSVNGKRLERIKAISDLDDTIQCIILAFIHCFYLRISSKTERDDFLGPVSQILRISKENIMNIVRDEEDLYIESLLDEEGIAKNSALRENIFAIFPCIMNKIPVFICGKPGCSKSLSVKYLCSNLKSSNMSKNLFLRHFPSLLLLPFQGSESCTSEGVESIFLKAYKLYDDYSANKKNPEILPVILFDEIGLAEISVHNPLKVLHKHLEHENKKIGFIGISNWALDASKMNRALYLARPEPDLEDLKDTARALCLTLPQFRIAGPSIYQECLYFASDIYWKIQIWMKKNKPSNSDFYGLRDFYHTIKYISREFNQNHRPKDLNRILFKAFERNFGGSLNAIKQIKLFFKELHVANSMEVKIIYTPVLELIKENIKEAGSRYLMIIAQKEVAMYLLENELIVPSSNRKVMIGSSFDSDQNKEETTSRMIGEVIRYLDTDSTLIFMDMDSIYTSLYDLFNQNFTKGGNRNYCKIALGAHFNPRCCVDELFKCIVFLEDDDNIIASYDPPFLNRFEKHWVNLDQLLKESYKEIVKELDAWVDSLVTLSDGNGEFDSNIVFPIYSKKYSPYLVLRHAENCSDNILERCKISMLKVSSVDLLFLLDIIDMHSDDKERIQKQWEENHKETFLEMINRPVRETAKIIALTYDSVSIESVIESVDDIHSKILSSFTSEKHLKSDISRFYSSENKIYIIEVDFSKEAKHLMLLKSEINNIIKDNAMLGKEKKFIVIVRMHRNDKHRVPIRFDLEWEMTMYEDLKSSHAELLIIKGKTIISMISEDALCNFRDNISELTENALLSFKYESLQTGFEPNKHKYQILELIKDKEKLIEDFKKKTIHIVKSKSESLNLSWKISIFTEPKIIAEAFSLHNALELMVKKELQQGYSLVLFILEKEYSLYSHINSYLNIPQLKTPSKKYFSSIKIESIKMKQSNNNNILYYVDGLKVPFVYDAYQKLNECYWECLEEKKEASDQKEKLSILMGDKDIMGFKELLQDNDIQKVIIQDFIIQDFIRVILYENSQESNYLDLLYQTIKRLVPSKNSFDVLLDVIIHQEILMEISNIFVLLVKLNSNDPIILESLQEDLPTKEISDKLETNIGKIVDWIIFKLNLSKLELNEDPSKYLPLLENMFIILGRIIKTHKLSTSIFILEFWIELSRTIPSSSDIKSISNKINEYTDQDFICKKEFQKYLNTKLDKFQLKQNQKFRVFILYQLISRDPMHIDTLYKEINNITNDLWKVSSKCMDLIIEKSCLLDAYDQITYEDSSEIFNNDHLNKYLEQIELNMPTENQFYSNFCVLLSDRLCRYLQDDKITQMIAENNEEFILDDSIKLPLEFFIKYYNNTSDVYPKLTKLICCSKICEYLKLYADYLFRKQKYQDETNVSGVFENLFTDTRDGKSFGNYCLKMVKEMCGDSYDKLYNLALLRKGSSLMKTVSERYTEFIYLYLPFLEGPDAKKIEESIINKPYADFAACIKKVSNIKDEIPENTQDGTQGKKKKKILSIVVCFLNKMYTSYLSTEPIHLVDLYRRELEKNPQTIVDGLEKNNLQLLKHFLCNFEGKEDLKYLSLINGEHENNKRNIILCFMISIMSAYKDANCVLTTPFKSINKVAYSIRELIASRNSINDENNRGLIDLKIEMSRFAKYEQYYRCSGCSFGFISKKLPETKCQICNLLSNRAYTCRNFEANPIIDEEIAKSIKTSIENLGDKSTESIMIIPMEKPLNFYLIELLVLSYSYFLTIIGVIVPEPGGFSPINLLQKGINTCFTEIKKIINCKNYYIFMLSFLSKLVNIMQKKLTIAEFKEELEQIVSSTSHAELSKTYKESYFNSYLKSSKSNLRDLEEITTYLDMRNPIRIKQEIDIVNFKRVYSSQVNKAKYPYVEIYLKYQDKIDTLKSLCPILDFTNSLLRKFSFQISRTDAEKLILASVLSESKILSDKFEKFTEAWKKLSTIKFSSEEKAPPYCDLKEDLALNYFLVDTNPDDNGRYIEAALVYLGKLNNEILESIKEFTSEKMINRSPVPVQKLKSTDIIRFDFDIYQAIEKTSVINPNYGMGEEVLYDFERTEFNVKRSLQRGRIVDTDNLSCIQYTNEILNSHSKYRGVINEIRRNVPQNNILPETLRVVKKLLEALPDKKELHNSMNKLLVVIQERKINNLDSVEKLCKIIKFKLHSVFTRSMGTPKNAITSLSISNIIHLHEIIEELAFPAFLDTVSNKYNREIDKKVKEEIGKCLKTVEQSGGKYPTAQEIMKAIMKFIIRCLIEDLDTNQKIIAYIANSSFWNYNEEEMKKVEGLKNDFKEMFKVLNLSESIGVYNAVKKHLASINVLPEQEPPKKQKPIHTASKRIKGNYE